MLFSFYKDLFGSDYFPELDTVDLLLSEERVTKVKFTPSEKELYQNSYWHLPSKVYKKKRKKR